MNDDQKRQTVLARYHQAAQVFTPGAPVDKYALFAGRGAQVHEVINAIAGRGLHVLLFGERGVGKTSLANVLVELLGNAGLKTVESGSINCDTADTFASLWHKIFREISYITAQNGMGFSATERKSEQSLEEFLPKDPSPEDVRYLLRSLKAPTIIVIDEIDRLRDAQAKALLADTIKTLSDHSASSTLVLVGVADSVAELIAEHQSIERALVQVRMPRMSHSELLEIIDKGLEQLGMAAEDNAKQRVTRLSQGLPHYTHLLALHACQNAISEERDHITDQDVEKAIRLAVQKAQQSTLTAYHKATSSPKKNNLYSKVLLACALASTDDLGYFAAADVRAPLSEIMGKQIDIPAFSRHLDDFANEARGRILHKTGTSWKFRFRFANPLMQPFVIVHGLANGTLTENVLTQFTQEPSDHPVSQM